MTHKIHHAYSPKHFTPCDANSTPPNTLQSSRPTSSPTHTSSHRPPLGITLLTCPSKFPLPPASHILFTSNINNGFSDLTRTVHLKLQQLSPLVSPIPPPSCSPYLRLSLSSPPSTPLCVHTKSPPHPISNYNQNPTLDHQAFHSTNIAYTPTFTQLHAKPKSNLLPPAHPLDSGAPTAKNGADPHHHQFITKILMKLPSTKTPFPFATPVSTVSTAPYPP